MEREENFCSPLSKMQQQSNRSDNSSCKDSSADNQDVFVSPQKNLDMRKNLQNLSSLWGCLPDLNQNIMAEIARRRNVTDEFYDDIFKGKAKDTTCISSSKNLDPFLSRSTKDHGATKQICDGSVSSKAANEYPTYGEKVKSWKDSIPEQVVKGGGKSKQGLGHGAEFDIDNGEDEDEFGSYVIEFGSDVKKEPN